MKQINILSLVEAYRNLNEETYNEYLSYNGISIKNDEIEDIESIIHKIYSTATSNNLSGFYVGYKIPQIGKEFDLLRFGKDTVLNIEIKSSSTQEKIHKQLIRNKYYLSYMGKSMLLFAYVSSDDALYTLGGDGKLTEASPRYLVDSIRDQRVEHIDAVDDLFNPSNYLVSPFNSTDKFLEGGYFLTEQQEYIKVKIMDSLDEKTKYSFISITGSAGTGKTLLIYDIAKTLAEKNKKNLIVHCGKLNSGQNILINHGWEIIPIKNLENYDLLKYEVIMIDEAQRIYPSQLDEVITKIKQGVGSCIFSYDKVQTLAKFEENNNIDHKINEIVGITKYNLSEKIRTNKEIATFIKMFFNNKRNLPISVGNNIELHYFKSIEGAKEYLGTLDACEWEIIHFTPSRFEDEYHEKYSDVTRKTSHKVIGQEFDRVAVIIDKHFSYDECGSLIYRDKTYYDATKMIFQNMTRTRKKLNLVIIDNEKILERCMRILQGNP
jgi:hypothetical protein